MSDIRDVTSTPRLVPSFDPSGDSQTLPTEPKPVVLTGAPVPALPRGTLQAGRFAATAEDWWNLMTTTLAALAPAADVRHPLVKKVKVAPHSGLDEFINIQLMGEENRLLCTVILWSTQIAGRKRLQISGVHLEPPQSKGQGLGTAVMAAIFRAAVFSEFDEIVLMATEDGRRAWTREEFGLNFGIGMVRAIQQSFAQWRDNWAGRSFLASDEGKKYLASLQAQRIPLEAIGDRPHLYPPQFLYSWSNFELKRDLRTNPISEKEIWRLETLVAFKGGKGKEPALLIPFADLLRMNPSDDEYEERGQTVGPQTPVEKIKRALEVHRDELRPLLRPDFPVEEAENIYMELLTHRLLWVAFELDIQEGLWNGIRVIGDPAEILRHLGKVHYAEFTEGDTSFAPLDLFYLLLAGIPPAEILERLDRRFFDKADSFTDSPVSKRPHPPEYLAHRAAVLAYYGNLYQTRHLSFREFFDAVSLLPKMEEDGFDPIDLDWLYCARYILPLYEGPLTTLSAEALTELNRRKHRLFFLLSKVRASLAETVNKRNEVANGVTERLKQALATDGVDVDVNALRATAGPSLTMASASRSRREDKSGAHRRPSRISPFSPLGSRRASPGRPMTGRMKV